MILHRICNNCEQRSRPCAGPCPCKANGQDILDNISDLTCPLGKFTEEGIAEEKARPKNDGIARTSYWPYWAGLHRRPLFCEDLCSEQNWLDDFAKRLPCGNCRRHWLRLLSIFLPDFSSDLAYFRWTVEAHNRVSESIGKPPMTAARAARIHGCRALMPPDELASDIEPIRLCIVNRWTLGDEVVCTAIVRDLLAAFPGEYEISVSTEHPEVFDGLGVRIQGSGVRGHGPPEMIFQFPVGYAGMKPDDLHFIDYVHARFVDFIGRQFARGPLRPWIVRNAECTDVWYIGT